MSCLRINGWHPRIFILAKINGNKLTRKQQNTADRDNYDLHPQATRRHLHCLQILPVSAEKKISWNQDYHVLRNKCTKLQKKNIKADQICAKNTHIDLTLRHKKKTLNIIWNEISNVL